MEVVLNVVRMSFQSKGLRRFKWLGCSPTPQANPSKAAMVADGIAAIFGAL
jgi:hypothetical protein